MTNIGKIKSFISVKLDQMISMVLLLLSLMISSLISKLDSTSDKKDEKYKYSILIDAGSTGSRIYLYQFSLLHPNISENSVVMNRIADSLTEIGQFRVHPAISSFVNDIKGLSDQINGFKYHINIFLLYN
jgi:Golgi nucleoside diphosphatase